MMDVNETHCDNNFVVDVSQIVMLYALHLYTAICQKYLNKTGGEKNLPSRQSFPSLLSYHT